MSAVYLVLLVLPFIYLSWKKWISKFSTIPCPLAVPWLGNTPFFKLDSHQFFKQMFGYMEKYNFLCVLWLGPSPVICSGKKEHAKYVLGSNEIIRKSSFYHFLQHWLGLGLLLSWGGKWKKRRKVITPSFHFSVLADFADMFMEHADLLVKKLQESAKQKKTIDIQEFARLATLDIICETAMGVKVNAQTSHSEYANTIAFVNNQLIVRIRSPWLWPDVIYKLTPNGRLYYKSVEKLHQFTTNIINERLATRMEKQTVVNSEPASRKKAFLDTLLDLYDKGEIDIEGIREEVDTFMFEGHDTTAAGFGFIMYLLGSNPEVQRKLQQEVDASFSKACSLTERVSSLKYLDCVIKEGLRLHSPVLFMGRLVEKDTKIGDLIIPKGTEILITPGAIHRNPEYWPEPNEFRPERFSDKEFDKRDPYIYVPFSAGPRNCIGQKFAMLELKVMLYYVMRNVSVTSLQQYEDLELTLDIIHHSRNGLLLQVEER